ncbi:hypothetical protein PM082_014315 [Marasmius tenuissimus]|nr:hypothetical protein PM082_014315 [Marasmius tenuissimus]
MSRLNSSLVYVEPYGLASSQGYQQSIAPHRGSSASYEPCLSQVQGSAADLGNEHGGAYAESDNFASTTNQVYQQSSTPHYGITSYEPYPSQVQEASSENVNTVYNRVHVELYGFASTNNQVYHQPPAPHHGSSRYEQYLSQAQASPGNVDSSHSRVHAGTYSFASATTQGYQQSTAPHYGSSGHHQYLPQVHGSPTAISVGVQHQPGQRYGPYVSSRNRPVHATSHIPTSPSAENNFRREVGSPAVTEAANARRQKDAPYKCGFQECSSTFTSQANLNYHTLAHEGVSPYPCGRCGYRFRSRNDLARHERRKTPCRPP